MKVNHTAPEQDKQYFHQKTAHPGVSASQLHHLVMFSMPTSKPHKFRGLIARVQNHPGDDLPGNKSWINALASESGGKPRGITDEEGLIKSNSPEIVID